MGITPDDTDRMDAWLLFEVLGAEKEKDLVFIDMI